jgi:hypothetical protein
MLDRGGGSRIDPMGRIERRPFARFVGARLSRPFNLYIMQTKVNND